MLRKYQGSMVGLLPLLVAVPAVNIMAMDLRTESGRQQAVDTLQQQAKLAIVARRSIAFDSGFTVENGAILSANMIVNL